MKKSYLLFIFMVLFLINSHGFVINKVNLAGNNTIMDSVIKLSISVREGDKIPQSEKELVDFSENLKNEILELGFFGNAAVTIVPVSREAANLNIQVLEFPVIKDIIIEGEEEILDRNEIISRMKTKKGDILNINSFREDLISLRDYFFEKGVILGGESSINLSEEFDKVIIKIYRSQVNSIEIEGNLKTRDNVITRELEFEVGSAYDFVKMRRSYQNLANTGYFKKIDFIPQPNEDGDIDLKIEIEEDNTGEFRFGGTYGSENGLTGLIEVREKNFKGKGFTLNVKAEFGGYDNYELGYYNPRWKDKKISQGINFYDTKYERDSYSSTGVFLSTYEERKKGFNISWGKYYTRFSRFGATFYNENIQISPATAGIKDKNSQTLSLSISKDVRDNIFYPTYGYYAISWIDYTGGLLKGPDEYTRYTTDFRNFKQLSPRMVLATRIKYGKIDVREGSVEDYELLSLGGGNSLRGYRLREFSGTEMALGNLEFRYSMSEAFKLCFFYDTGSMNFNDRISKSGSKSAYGIGLQFKTPLGILRLDWGKPVESGRKTRNYFNFGPIF